MTCNCRRLMKDPARRGSQLPCQGHEWMWMRGGWDLMAHGVIFIDYNQQGGPRGAGKAESVNWRHADGAASSWDAARFCFAKCFRRNR